MGIKLDNCFFPSNCLYDLENLTWIRFLDEDENENENEIKDDGSHESKPQKFLIGMTPIYSYLAGKLTTLRLKDVGSKVQKNKSVATIDSVKHFGTIRTPLAGKIIETNQDLIKCPKLVNDSPFGKGWIAKLVIDRDSYDISQVKKLEFCKDELVSQIKKYNVKCFKAFPDFQMIELGTECSATLAKLDEFMGKTMRGGDTIRLVSDDPTADLELMSWANRNQQEIVEIVEEKIPSLENKPGYRLLFNIIIRKK